MNNVDINTAVLILFFIIIVGYIARKTNIITRELNKGLSGLLVNVTLPLLIISSFNREYDSKLMENGTKILIFAFLIHIFLFLLGQVFYIKNEESKKKVLIFYGTFSNTGFMGFPILGSIYGDTGIFYAAIFNIAFNLLVWTLGVSIFTGERDLKSIRKVIVNPSFIAVIIGIIIFRFSIPLPKAIFGAVELVGHTTTPLSMIIIGAMLAEMKVYEIFTDLSIYYGSFIRLLLIPMILYYIMSILGVEEQIRNICIILEAMPAAVTTAIVAEKYEGNALYASQSIFITNIICLITIPFIISFLGV
ncbi:AEC family transporter [Oceanirhabdus sp. W0125-5]|uniref:AEC family transporter n=1 Tax=Oceanirhabdus sp. W0125-5 TaxID=2999116 RepID=UPI0022F31DF5|nr:AEC family transporter [Oceanirhabdus sp. W0125-5]WBW99593.1 AEC family transporter [Oceanirhabdus sp. W0125-5]